MPNRHNSYQSALQRQQNAVKTKILRALSTEKGEHLREKFHNASHAKQRVIRSLLQQWKRLKQATQNIASKQYGNSGYGNRYVSVAKRWPTVPDTDPSNAMLAASLPHVPKAEPTPKAAHEILQEQLPNVPSTDPYVELVREKGYFLATQGMTTAEKVAFNQKLKAGLANEQRARDDNNGQVEGRDLTEAKAAEAVQAMRSGQSWREVTLGFSCSEKVATIKMMREQQNAIKADTQETNNTLRSRL